MKRIIKAGKEYREEIIDLIEDLRDKNRNLEDEFANILITFGAGFEDSGPEGFYSTMTTSQINRAYDAMKELVANRQGKEYENTRNLLLSNGYKIYSVDSSYGSVEYFVKGDVGIIVTSPGEAKALAKKLL